MMEMDDHMLSPYPELKDSNLIEIINDDLYYYGDVEQSKMLYLTKTLKEKENELLSRQAIWRLEEIPPIHLHIQSDGGMAHSGFGGYDLIRDSKLPIYTYIEGFVASAATLLSIAGTKRYMTKNSFLLIHQLRHMHWGTYTHAELKDELKNSEALMKALTRIYRESTKLPEDILLELMSKNLYFNAEECLKYGIVDEII